MAQGSPTSGASRVSWEDLWELQRRKVPDRNLEGPESRLPLPGNGSSGWGVGVIQPEESAQTTFSGDAGPPHPDRFPRAQPAGAAG